MESNTSFEAEKNKVMQEILDDVKMTKKEIRTKLQEHMFKKEEEDKELRNKKMDILDKLSDSLGEQS